MAIKVGDEVAVMATVLKRVTEDRVSVSIPGYNFPHSVIGPATKLTEGQPMELSGDVTQIEGDKVTVSFGQWSPWIWTRCTWCKATSRRSEGI
ncbi:MULTISPECIES: hypothetical protein [unclassified Mesorhizobium]|uniref:hypothetical protein n=1 Tax=unclassified Mesorhizobium TaxID=325217 RepID=UPI003335D147